MLFFLMLASFYVVFSYVGFILWLFFSYVGFILCCFFLMLASFYVVFSYSRERLSEGFFKKKEV